MCCLLHFISSGRRRRRRAVACLCFYVMCRPTEEGEGPAICVPWPDDTPLESVARNNISCIWYPISMLFSPPIIALPSFCDRISRILNSNTCLSPRSVVFVLVLRNPQVSFNSPSISKTRCGQGYGLALGSWFLYQRHFSDKPRTIIKIYFSCR